MKILLLLLTSFCYGNTVFEFFDNEKDNNFANESHSYVQQHHNHDFGNDVTQDIPFCDLTFNILPDHNFSANARSLSSRSFYERFFYPPPDKLYLLHLSLLI